MNNIAIRCDHCSFIGEIQGNRLSVIPLLKKGCGCGGEFHDDDCKCSCTDYRRDPLCTMHTEGATTQPTPASEAQNWYVTAPSHGHPYFTLNYRESVMSWPYEIAIRANVPTAAELAARLCFELSAEVAPPCIYVASRALPERAAMWRALRSVSAVPIVSTWIDQDGVGDSNYGTLWPAIMEEIRSCTALILYVEPEDFPLKGAFVEVGAALALGKRVYCVLPGVVLEARSMRPVGSWMHHPLVTKCDSIVDAYKEITK